MYEIVLVRHGQSEFNLQNRFTGWKDPDLTEQGVQEAIQAGQLLKKEGFTFDLAFSSLLSRSIKTLHYILEELELLWIPEQKFWELNERHYGALEGLNKEETARKYGEEQLHLWRRSLSVRPPQLSNEEIENIIKDPRYSSLRSEQIPYGESLEDAVHRVGLFWESTIVPLIQQKNRIIISAHGNTIRALIKFMEDIDEDQLIDLNIPTGIPLVYKLDQNIRPIKRYYLGNPELIMRKMNAVAQQGQLDARKE